MSRISQKIKLECVDEYFQGKRSISALAKSIGVDHSVISDWIRVYECMGPDALVSSKNKTYSAAFKQAAVRDYLSGAGSLRKICEKYQIKAPYQLRQWIKKYNGHEELKTSKSGGKSIMTKGRKTTFEERVEIVKHCIEHDHNYTETAEKYQISYQQARNYTLKYEEDGIDGLVDRRGKRKTEDDMTEVEKLRAEIRLLKAKQVKAKMEISFLKKLDKIERGRS